MRSEAMEDETIDVRDYPELALLCWNRAGHSITRADAFRLYEREWRLVYPERMIPEERELLRRLSEEFGHGVINA